MIIQAQKGQAPLRPNFDASSRIQAATLLCMRCLKAVLKVL